MMKYPIGIQSFDKIRACLNFAQVNLRIVSGLFF